MSGQAAGAPLRAVATLAAIWILVRVISWNVPANIGVAPVSPINGKTAFHDGAQIYNAKKQRLTEFHISAPVAPRDIVDMKHDTMILSYPARRAIDLTSADWPVSQRRLSLPMMQPEVVGYGLPPALPPKRAGSLSQRIDPETLPVQNIEAKGRGSGFSGYFWIFTRQDFRAKGLSERRGETIISNGQYGGSQIGAILSYPILTKPAPELAVYGRLTAALAPLAQEEFAFGLRIHPIHNLPFSIHAEQRLDADSGGDRGTAFYVAGGTGPDHIVEQIALETYAQAGYVLGVNETYFFDGSATLQRLIAESDRKKLSMGAGVWAGGQRNVTRLDVGPRAAFRIPLGPKSARIVVDWRVRVAGDARPGTGLAITVSTGF